MTVLQFTVYICPFVGVPLSACLLTLSLAANVVVMASCAWNTERPGTLQPTRHGMPCLPHVAVRHTAANASCWPAACRLELDRHELLRRSHDCLGLATMDAPSHDDPFTLAPPPGYRDRGHHDKEVGTPLWHCDTPHSEREA